MGVDGGGRGYIASFRTQVNLSDTHLPDAAIEAARAGEHGRGISQKPLKCPGHDALSNDACRLFDRFVRQADVVLRNGLAASCRAHVVIKFGFLDALTEVISVWKPVED